MKTLVTGAGGFIGGAVCRTLAAEPDIAVIGATRNGRPLGEGIAPCRLDICDPDALRAALSGVDAVVHCAVGPRHTTVAGTQMLLEAARRAGVRRFVHLSSIAVYGTAQGEVGESAETVPAEGNGYAHWKVAAEAKCREAARQGEMAVVILRPSIVYGPGSLQWVIRPAARLLGGNWGKLDEIGRGTCNLVHVDDVASACLAALRADAQVASETFNISGRETITWHGWYARMAAALGCPQLRDIPAASWRRRAMAALPFMAMARVLPGAGRLFKQRILSAPSRSELTLFALAATYPIGKAETQLGWRPRIGMDEGLAGSVAWLRSAGIAR